MTKEKKKIEKEENVTEEKRKFNKLIIILCIILIIVIIVAIVVRIKYNDKDTKNNSNDKEELMINEKKNVVKDKEVDGISFSDVLLLSQNEQTYLTLKITNNTTDDTKIEEIHIFFKDKNGNDMINYLDEDDNYVNYLVGYVGDIIKSGESRDIVSSIDTDISNDTYTLEYEIIK